MKLLSLLALVLLAAMPAAAQTVRVASGSELIYRGSAPLHDWEGRSTQVSGTLALDLATPSASSIRLSVPVASFDSGNGRRDRKMREATEADLFPSVTFVSRSVTAEPWAGTGQNRRSRWTVQGDLTFHGVTRPITATVDVEQRRGVFTASPTFEIDMTDFGIERPGIGPAKVSPRLRFRGTIRAGRFQRSR